jgi:hypothetical protein
MDAKSSDFNQQSLGTPIVADSEVAFFRENGFVVPQNGLPDEVKTGLCAVVEGVLRDNEDWPNLLRMPHVPKRAGLLEGVVGGEHVFRYAVHPALLNIARSMCGPDVIMWGSEIFAKPAGVGKATPWHQDNYTPAVRAMAAGERSSAISIWIAVDDVGTDNGCLRFVPGSGKGGNLPHSRLDTAGSLLNFNVEERNFDEASAVDAILPSGHFSIHDSYVLHGAKPNTSGRRRAAITLHYMAAHDVYDRSFGMAKGSGLSKPAPIALRPIWLVLGENRNPANDFKIGHEQLADLDDWAETARRQYS